MANTFNTSESEKGVVTFKIYSEGTDITNSIGVIGFQIKRRVNWISAANLVLSDGNLAEGSFKISDSNDFLPGKKIKIDLGYGTEEKTVFEGIVVKQSLSSKNNQSSTLTVNLKHEAVKATSARNNKYFLEKTDADIIEEVLKDHGLKINIDGAAVTHKEMVQYNVCDWDFACMRAEANGLLILTDDKGVKVVNPKLSEPALAIGYGHNVIEFEAEMDARFQVEAVKAKAWDYSKQELGEAEGAKSTLADSSMGNFSAAKLADVMGVKEANLYHPGMLTSSELQAWADAKRTRIQLAKMRGRVKIEGVEGIFPGDTIDLSGMGDRFNGKAFVSGICHEMAGGVWTTDITFGMNPERFTETYTNVNEPPVSGLLAPISGLQVATVTSLEDPDALDRIQIKLPVISPSEEGIWARVVNLNAGNETGTYFRPDVGQEVIVGFLNQDPRNAVILGAVHHADNPPPFEASDDNFEKGIITNEKMKLVFNDEKKSILIETPEGNKISISEDEKVILIEDQNKNKIEMSKDGITIESAKDFIIKAKGDVKIDGANIEQKAKSEFKADGKGGVELTSSAIATIKGSLVKIN